MGTTTITYSVYGETATCEVTVDSIVEDFSEGSVANNKSYTNGAISVLNQENQTLALENERLKITDNTAVGAGNAGAAIEINNLEVGTLYKLSYDVQIVKGYFPNIFLVYRAPTGSGFDNWSHGATHYAMYWSAADGFIANANGGSAYLTEETHTEEKRFENNTFYGYFVADTTTVKFRMSYKFNGPVEMYLDNVKVEKVAAADCSIVGADEVDNTAEYSLKHGEAVVPEGKDATQTKTNWSTFYWSVDDTGVATIDAETGALTAVAGGDVTIRRSVGRKNRITAECKR